jgi:hypothetical protein
VWSRADLVFIVACTLAINLSRWHARVRCGLGYASCVGPGAQLRSLWHWFRASDRPQGRANPNEPTVYVLQVETKQGPRSFVASRDTLERFARELLDAVEGRGAKM